VRMKGHWVIAQGNNDPLKRDEKILLYK